MPYIKSLYSPAALALPPPYILRVPNHVNVPPMCSLLILSGLCKQFLSLLLHLKDGLPSFILAFNFVSENRIHDFLKGCHPIGMDLKYIDYDYHVTHFQ